MLHRLLKQVVAHRISLGKKEWDEEPVLVREEGKIIFDEVADVIDLPGFVFKRPQDPDTIDLSPQVENQLRTFVSAVANAYHNNPFNCLQHASAVTMHLSKLLSRIVVKELDGIEEEDEEDDYSDDTSSEDNSVAPADIEAHLHNHTYASSLRRIVLHLCWMCIILSLFSFSCDSSIVTGLQAIH